MDAISILKVISISFTGFINAYLGIIVLLKNPRSNINRVFFVGCFFMAIWAFCLLFYEFPIILNSLFWINATYFTVSVSVVFVFLFSFIFPTAIYPRIFKWGVVYSLLFLGATLILLCSKTWIINVTIDPLKGLQTHLGVTSYILWLILIISTGQWTIFNFISNKKRISNPPQKAQLQYLFIGLFLWEVVVVFSDAVIPLVFKDTRLFSISAISSLFFTFSVGYTILRHRFMDIRFALRRVIIHTFLSLFIAVFFITSALIYWYLSGNSIRSGVFLLILIASMILAVIFSRLQSLSEFLARKFFFQSIYNYQNTLKDLSQKLSTILEMPKLVDVIINTLMTTMGLDRIAVLIRDFSSNHYKIQKTIGFDENNGISLVKENFLTSYLESKPQVIVLEEIKNLFDEAFSEEDRTNLKMLADNMELIQASLIVPVVSSGRVISLIVLGNKKSGDSYTVQDIELLNIIASQASIAIENAGLYKQVEGLNQNLQAKITEATQELQKRNLELEFAYKKLQTLDQMKDQLITITSHELRTPMTAIKSYLWLALNRPDVTLSEKLIKYISRAYISTERLINLVNDMLNVSRIEAGNIEIRPQVFNIQNLISDTITEITPKINEKGINVQILKNSVPNVFADPDKTREVVLNLLGNAIKFTPNQGLITISYFSDGQTVEISVKDSGVGISEEDLKRLFQKFVRLDSSYVAAATSGGTGLGLYISKNLIELMHGKIWAVSEGLGKGTTFIFSLPVATKSVLSQSDQYSHQVAEETKPLESVVI